MLSDPDIRATEEGLPGHPSAGPSYLPAPRWFREEALSTFGAGLVRAPVADLSYDSLLPDGDRLESAFPGRILEFRDRAGHGVNLFVEDTGSRLHVGVQLLPATRATLGVLRYGQPARFVEADGTGHARFSADPVLLSIVIHDGDGPRLQTSWVRI